MSRRRRSESDAPSLPPLYAMVHGGIEAIAADEITRDLGGEARPGLRSAPSSVTVGRS